MAAATKNIAAKELKARLEAGEPMAVVDIREAGEFDSWHIVGSANLPVYDALRRNDEAPLRGGCGDLPRDRPLITVCRAGILSEKAAGLLRSLGFDAISLRGGIRGWGSVWSEAAVTCSKPGRSFFQVRRNGKGCLSYLFGADGRAAVVDPSVDVEAYTDIAERERLEITHVLETHVHADHLSRARELCRRTGALLLLPRNQRVTFEYTPVDDGTTLAIGPVSVQAIHTPGHTGESTCYLVDGEILLTGDTLFVDSVGRPDLEKGDAGATEGARSLYASLKRGLLERFEEIWFYPCHHGGPIGFESAPIAGSLSQARQMDLLGHDESTFVRTIVEGLQAKPGNYTTIIAVNEGKAELGGADPLDLEAGPNSCAAR